MSLSAITALWQGSMYSEHSVSRVARKGVYDDRLERMANKRDESATILTPTSVLRFFIRRKIEVHKGKFK